MTDIEKMVEEKADNLAMLVSKDTGLNLFYAWMPTKTKDMWKSMARHVLIDELEARIDEIEKYGHPATKFVQGKKLQSQLAALRGGG